MGGRNRPESVAAFARNGWPLSSGIGGRNRPEYAMGLDKPVYVQYAIYLSDVFSGSFGQSVYTMQPVRKMLIGATVNSLKLAITAVIFGLLIGIPLGVIAGVKRFTLFENAARFIAVFGMSAPHFWVGIVLIEVVAVRLGLLRAGGMHGLESYILPGLTQCTVLVAGIMRLLRSSMISALDSDFVKFARMKGVPERIVIWKHALRNALIPVLGFSGVYIALLLTAAVTTEVVFAWPGLGRLVYTSVLARDFPVVQGGVTFFVFIAIFVNLLVDIMYSVIDPRIRLK